MAVVMQICRPSAAPPSADRPDVNKSEPEAALFFFFALKCKLQ